MPRTGDYHTGTFYTRGATKADIVREVTAKQTAKMKLVGDELYVVHEYVKDNQVKRCIVVYCLVSDAEGWGYKPIDECMHPYYYACPLSFLKLAPVACQAWRDGVKEYHAAKKRP